MNEIVPYKRVILESPYAGQVMRNKEYALNCMLDMIERGEATFASHLLYPQVLDDEDIIQREGGILAGFSWMAVAELVAVYTDLGISKGMRQGMRQAEELGIPIVFRDLEWPI